MKEDLTLAKLLVIGFFAEDDKGKKTYVHWDDGKFQVVPCMTRDEILQLKPEPFHSIKVYQTDSIDDTVKGSEGVKYVQTFEEKTHIGPSAVKPTDDVCRQVMTHMDIEGGMAYQSISEYSDHVLQTSTYLDGWEGKIIPVHEFKIGDTVEVYDRTTRDGHKWTSSVIAEMDVYESFSPFLKLEKITVEMANHYRKFKLIRMKLEIPLFDIAIKPLVTFGSELPKFGEL